MSPLDASIGSTLPHISQAMADSKNNEFNDPSMDPNMFREPKRLIYLYSLSDAELTRELPPQIKKTIIPARGDKRYVLVQRIPDPFNQPDTDQNGRMICHYIDGRRIAMDICNPDNSGFDQDAKLNPTVAFSEGNNYAKLGVFWSLTNPPTEAELLAAEARKEAHYRFLLQQARVWETSNPAMLSAGLTPTHFLAAQHFGEEHSWCKIVQRPAECPNCGETIKRGVAYHRSEVGVCVIDWQRAVDAGVKTRADVPEEKRWWKEKGSPKV